MLASDIQVFIHCQRSTVRVDLPSKQVSLGGSLGTRCDRRLPVRLVNEHSSEVTINVDHTEHETVTGCHGQVGATGQGFHGGRTTEQKHRCHNNVGGEAEEEEGYMEHQ